MILKWRAVIQKGYKKASERPCVGW